MGAEAFHNYAASFAAQHLHKLNPAQFDMFRRSKTAAGSKAGPTAKPSAPTAPTRPAPIAQQKPMTQADRDDWAQAMGNRLKRKHEASDQAHHDYLMERSGDALNRIQRERRAQYGSGEASDLLHTFNRRMDDIQGQTKPTGSGTAHDDVEAAFGPRKSASTPTPSTSSVGSEHAQAFHIDDVRSAVKNAHGATPLGSEKAGVYSADELRASAKDPHGSIPSPVTHEDTHGQQFTGSAPSTLAPKRSSGGYRAKAAHEGAWDGTFPHQEPVDLSGFDHAPVKDAPAAATSTPSPAPYRGTHEGPAIHRLNAGARDVKFSATMKEVGREGSDPGANRIQARFTRHDAAPANWPKPGKQRAAQHGLFPVNQIKKVGRTKAPTPEPEHDPRTPGPGQTSLSFGHDESAPIHNPKQFGQGHIF